MGKEPKKYPDKIIVPPGVSSFQKLRVGGREIRLGSSKPNLIYHTAARQFLMRQPLAINLFADS
jgi:hypothetical protein